jgi:hypothetical protein
MDWYKATGMYHELTFPHDCQLSSLPETWQRELAAIWRLEADVNNGSYLQFIGNWKRESYVYAIQALHKIGARKMAELIENCQALVDEHFDLDSASPEQMWRLMPNDVIRDGKRIKNPGSVLPEPVLARVYELSYEFMSYPDDVAQIGLKYYGPFLREEH